MKTSREPVALAFGAALRAARKARGLSQESLAEGGDFHPTYPSMLERGVRMPTLGMVIELARGLRIDPRELIADALARLAAAERREARRPGRG